MIENFKNYLTNKKYKTSTIKEHLRNVEHFLNWCIATNTPLEDGGSYNDILSYVQHEQQRNQSVTTINQRLGSITKYYDCLKKEEIVSNNPALTIRIKGKLKTVTENPLTYKELESLYHDYKALQKEFNNHVSNRLKENSKLCHERNIIITGLLIWQGLHAGELQRLETGHINLQDGIIYIPSTSRSNSRELKLSTQQILSLHSYMHGGTREKLQPKEAELLPGNQHNVVNLLIEELKGINPQIKNAAHIRASVILHWLKQHNKRQTQYMIGHRCITSTEKYALQEMDTLTDLLSRHHPFT